MMCNERTVIFQIKRVIFTYLEILLRSCSTPIITHFHLLIDLLPPARLHVLLHYGAVVQLDVLVLDQQRLQVHVLKVLYLK